MYSSVEIPVYAKQAQYQIPPKSDASKGNRKSRKRYDHGKTFMWINAQIIASSEPGSNIDGLLNTINEHLHKMNLVNLTTAIHRLGKMVAYDAKAQACLKQLPILTELVQALVSVLSTSQTKNIQPQSLSNILWALASIRIVDEQVIALVCSHSIPNIDRFKSFELTTLLWALAKLSTIEWHSPFDMAPLEMVFDVAGDYILHHARTMGCRCLSMVVWAYATAKQVNAELFATAAKFIADGPTPSCQEMANTIWAYGTQNIMNRPLFRSLAQKAVQHLEEFKAQELSNMLWGFAASGFFHEHFFQQAASSALSKDLSAQHLANILWAFTRVSPRHPLTERVVLRFLPICQQQIRNFKAQEVSSVALSVAKAFAEGDAARPISLPLPVIDFFQCVSRIRHNLSVFSTQSLANMASAFAMVQLFDDPFLFKLGHEAVARASIMDANDLLRIFQVFLSAQDAGGDCGTIAQLLVSHLASRVKSLQPRDINAILLSCSDFLRDANRQDLLEECVRSVGTCSHCPDPTFANLRFGGDSKFECTSVAETDEPVHSISEMSDESAEEDVESNGTTNTVQSVSQRMLLGHGFGLTPIPQTNVNTNYEHLTPPPSSLIWQVDREEVVCPASSVIVRNTFIERHDAKPQGISAIQFRSEKGRRRRPSKVEDLRIFNGVGLSFEGRIDELPVPDDAYDTDDGF